MTTHKRFCSRQRRVTSHANDGFVAIRKRNLLTRNVEVFVYLWSVKSWALTICMENPEILWRIEMERFIPVEFSWKRNTFRGITFFPFLQTDDRNFFAPFAWIASATLHVERKQKINRYFVNGEPQSRSCFRYQKQYQYHSTHGKFSPKFPYKW